MTDLDLNKIKAGDYELVALSWDEPTSKPGEPYDFVTHRQGDTVTLNVEQARRLMVAGAVKPKGDKAEKSSKGKGGGSTDDKPPTDAGIDAITAYVGDDKERAAEYLEAEQAKGEAARTTLVAKLQAVVDA